MNAKPDQPGRPEADLAAAQARIRQLEEQLCEAEQELTAAGDIINEQEINIECVRFQLEAAELTIDEAIETRRKLEQRIADLEDALDALADNPCPVIVPTPQEQAPPQQPGYRPNPKVEAMIARFQPKENK